MNKPDAEELQRLYSMRFQPNPAYRQRVWDVLVKGFFQKYVPSNGQVLDIGCGSGEFINTVQARVKYGMDLNPGTANRLKPEVRFLLQDCSSRWPVPDACLDTIFTSNFFEHLADKTALAQTFDQAWRCLKPGGRLVAMGPNIRYLPGAYWDFWDHHIPLTELSLKEGMQVHGFIIAACHPRFLPYTMVGTHEYPAFVLACYLRLPWAWSLFGKQFLVVGQKPTALSNGGQ